MLSGDRFWFEVGGRSKNECDGDGSVVVRLNEVGDVTDGSG